MVRGGVLHSDRGADAILIGRGLVVRVGEWREHHSDKFYGKLHTSVESSAYGKAACPRVSVPYTHVGSYYPLRRQSNEAPIGGCAGTH